MTTTDCFKAQQGKISLGNNPSPQISLLGRECIFLFRDLGYELSYDFSSSSKKLFVSMKRIAVNEMFPKSLREIICHIVL